MAHTTVLLQKAISCLDLVKGDIYLDATSGGGGHLEEVYRITNGEAVLAGIDTDPLAIEVVDARFELLGKKIPLAVLNFRHIDKAPELLQIGKPNKILFDLGWNSDQFDTKEGEEGRGFSFKKDEPLKMTFGEAKDGELTAYELVNNWQEENIALIIKSYGEEQFATRIAKKIVERRAERPIKTSLELAEIIVSAVPVWYRFKKIHPATKTFQAIRIAVNDELQALEQGLSGAWKILEKGGRLAVISFHSLEDRIVKNFFKDKVENGEGAFVEDVGRKPIIPDDEEINQNPRSRSAKLRVIIKNL